MSRRLLGEELELATPRSWWCGIPANLDHVLHTLDACVVEPIASRPGMKRFVPGLLDAASRARLVDEIRSRPADWVGRERVERSVAPCWNDAAIAPASVLMRCFAIATPDGYQTMRGALARMSAGRSSGEELLLSSQGSKDVWVLAQGPVPPISLLRRPGQPIPLRRSGYDLPSRVADHLHWLGRHVERAEGTARLLRTVTNRLASESHQECAAEAAVLLNALAGPAHVRPEWRSPSQPGALWEMHAEIQALVHDGSRQGSVRESIDRLWRTASVVRDRISIDSWKVLSRVRRDSLSGRPAVTLSPGRFADVLPHLDTVIFELSAFAGLGMESMTRGPGWLFLDMGRRLERSAAMIQLLEPTLAATRPPVLGDGGRSDSQRLDEMLLEIADSSMTYRNRYPGLLEAAPLIDLLLIDETNPRSIGFQFAALADHVEALPDDDASPVLSGERRAVMDAVGQLRLADVDRLAEVDERGSRGELAALLRQLEGLVRKFSDAITHRYLVHSTPRRRLGDVPSLPANGA